MKTLFAISFFFFSIFSIKAQTVSVQMNSLNPFKVKSEEIFNLSIVNPTSVEINVKIIGNWILENKKVVVLTINNVTLKPGVNIINEQNYFSLEKQYFNNIVEINERNTSSLPPGTYKACISLQCVTNDCSGAGNKVISNEITHCIDVNIINPNPFLLTSPYNKAELLEKRPNFSWLPVTNIGSDLNIKYTLTLVKKSNQEQSCNEAIIRNRPLYVSEELTFPMLIYPGDLPDLDTGQYSWRVEAISNNTKVAISESWCFSVVNKKEFLDSNVYVKLTTTDHNIHHVKGNLYFLYTEIYSSELLQTQLFDQAGKELIINDIFSTNYGENKFVLDLSNLGLKKDTLYLLKIKDQAGKTYQLKFQLI